MHTIKVVSDLICPWCYIGKRRLEVALRELAAQHLSVSVSWHPFQLNPEMPVRGMNRAAYRMLKFGDWENCQKRDAQVTEVGRELGLEMRLDLQLNTPNTLDSHRVVWLAREVGVQEQVVEALFRAYFCDGIDLSERSNLVETAVSAGLEQSRLVRLLESQEGLGEVQAEEQAVKTLGLSSVPLFIIDDCVAVAGAQPAETLVKAIQQAKDQRRKQKRAHSPLDSSCTAANP